MLLLHPAFHGLNGAWRPQGGPAQRLEWLVEADGSIRVIPVAASPIQAFRGQGKQGGSSQRLLADREAEASLEA